MILPQYQRAAAVQAAETVHAAPFIARLRDASEKEAPASAARRALEEHGSAMTVMLTPGYAPFEQYSKGDKQGPWSDIYALGATLWADITTVMIIGLVLGTALAAVLPLLPGFLPAGTTFYAEDFEADYALFASLQWHISRQLTFQPALRYSYNTKYESPLTPSSETRFF